MDGVCVCVILFKKSPKVKKKRFEKFNRPAVG